MLTNGWINLNVITGYSMKWFKHFTHASSNNKLTKVRMKYGCEGYAIYWYCLELIAGDLGEKEDINFDLKHDAEVIGFNLKIDQIRVQEIMSYMVNINLFEEAEGVISCIKLAKYLDVKLTRNQSIKNIITAAKVDSGDRYGYLYIMLAKRGDYEELKIGRSTNPWARLPEIDRSRQKEGLKVSLLATFKTDDCISLETSLHQSFKFINIKNEWFQSIDGLKSLAEDINNNLFLTNDDVLRSDYVVNSSQLRSPPDKIRLYKIRLDKNKPKEKAIKEKDKKEIAFDDFWHAYPKKTGKHQALKSWGKLQPDIDKVMKALSWQTKLSQWSDKQFIPNPATYLNQRLWEDEPIYETEKKLTKHEQVNIAARSIFGGNENGFENARVIEQEPTSKLLD